MSTRAWLQTGRDVLTAKKAISFRQTSRSREAEIEQPARQTDLRPRVLAETDLSTRHQRAQTEHGAGTCH